jgi:hypothetical protein
METYRENIYALFPQFIPKDIYNGLEKKGISQ